MLKKAFRSALSLLLVFCLLLGLSANGFIVLAQSDGSDEDNELIYVSLGDSTTNGYGLSGYEFTQDDAFKAMVEALYEDYPNYSGEITFENPNGLLMETPGAYPALFKNYLETATGKEVNLIQLATSAMRADDVLTHLTWGTDEYFDIDDYSGNKFNEKYVIHNYSNVGAELPFEWEFVLGEEEKSMGLLFQNSVSEADVISINLGSNNFSIYMWGCLGPMIMGMMGNGNGEADYVPMMDDLLATVENEALRAFTKKVAEDVEGILVEKLAGAVEGETLQTAVENLADYGAYTFLSYCITYTKILDRINELNDHADIILIPPVNFMKGFTVDVNGNLVDMSEYITTILEAANTYVSTMAGMKDIEFENEIFWADHGGMVDMLMAEMVELEANNFEGAEVLHSRLISSLIYWVTTLSGGLFDLNSAGEVTREAVAAYKSLVKDPTDQEALGYFVTMFGGDMNAMGAYMANVGAYVGMEKALIVASQKEAVDVNLFLDIVGGTFSTKVSTVFGDVGNTVGGLASTGDLANILKIGDKVAEVLTRTENAEGEKDETAQGMLYVMAYFMVADGVVCHPSAKGYQTVNEKMAEAYEGGTSADDGSNSYLGEDVPVIKAIYHNLTANGYMSTDKAVAIVDYIYDLYDLEKQKLPEGALADIADYVYTSLVYDEDYTEKDSIAVIGIIGATLQEYGKIPTSDKEPAVAFAERLYVSLAAKGYLTDAQALAIVDFVFFAVLACDGDLAKLNVNEVIYFVYDTLFNWNGGAATFAFDLGDLGEINNESLTDLQKLDIILTVYDEFVASDVAEDYPEMEALGGLIDVLVVPDENGDAVIAPEKVVEIMQVAMDNIVNPDPGKDPEEAMKEVTNKVTEVVTDSVSALPPDKQIEVLNKVNDTLKELEEIEKENGSSNIPGGVGSILPGIGGGNEDDDTSISLDEIMKYVNIAGKAIENLKAEKLWGHYADGKYIELSTALIATLMKGEGKIDPAVLINDLYDVLFGDPNLSLEDKIQIVVVIYNTLAEDGTIKDLVELPTTGEAEDYFVELGGKIWEILDGNWADVIVELQGELDTLYGDLEAKTLKLNGELMKLVKLQETELNKLITERDELNKKLDALKAELDAARNGGLGTYSVNSVQNKESELIEELKAAIAETEAAIDALDAAITALTDKIAADLQGIEEIENAIEQIKAEIAATETALNAVLAAIDELNTELKDVYDATLVLNAALENLYGMTLGQVDGKAVLEAVNTIIDTVPAIVENLEFVYNQTQVAIEQTQAAIDTFRNFANDIQTNVDNITAGVENLAGLTAEQLEAIKNAAAECEKLVKDFVDTNLPTVEKTLEETYDDLEELANDEIAMFEQWFNENETAVLGGAAMLGVAIVYLSRDYADVEYKDGVLTITTDYAVFTYVNGELSYTLKDEGEELVNKYTGILNDYIDDLREARDDAQAWWDVNYPKALEELNGKLDALRTELENLDIKFENPFDDEYQAAKKAIEDEIKRLETLRDQLIEEGKKVDEYLIKVEGAISEVEAALNGVINAGHDVDGELMDLWNALTNLHGELVDLHNTVVDLHDATVEELFEIFGLCGIVADEFVNVLNTLPAYVDVLVSAVELVTSIDTWHKLDEVLQNAVKDLHDRLIEFLTEEETQQLIKDLIAQYGPVVAEQLLEAMVYLFEEYGHDVAVAFYNYLYNNPEEVIAFFNEYGSLILDLIVEYGDVVLVITALALTWYGPDLATYLVENHETILANLAYWWNIHGDKMIDLLQVYAEALGLCDAVREQIEILENAIESLEKELNDKVAEIEKELADLYEQLETATGAAKEAIEAKIAELEAMRDALIAEVEAKIAEVKAAIEALKAELENAINTGLTKIEELKAAIEELDQKVIELVMAAKQAAIEELNNAAANVEAALKALDAKLNELAGEVYEDMKTALKDMVWYLVDETIEAVKKYAPALDEALYNYLYNNPDEVIAFFNEYGYILVDLAEEYGDEALAIVGIALYLFGEDLATYIIENPEAVLADLVGWWNVYGDRIIAILQVYAEALGLCDAVRDEIANLENAIESLEKELNDKVAEIEKELADLYEQLETATGAVKEAIEAKIAALEAELAALKAEVEAKIAEVKAAIEELKAELDAAIAKGLADLEAVKDALLNLDEKVAELIEAAKKAALGEVNNAIANIEKAIENLDDALYQLLGVVYNDMKDALNELTLYLIDKLADAACKYFPEVDKAIYDYLYNHADEVIAFFQEYGYILADLIEEYGEEVLGIIAYALYMYGEELADYLIENYDTILEGLLAWVEEYGERVAAMLQVYAEALGLCDAVRDQIADLEAKLEDLKAELENASEEVKAAIEAEIAKIEAAIEELKEKLEALEKAITNTIVDLNETVEDIITEVENLIEEIEALVEEIEQTVAEIKAMVETAIENAIDEAVANLEVAVETLKSEAKNLVAELKAYVEELIEDALHADYEIDEESEYVALGDGAYAELLGQYLSELVASQNPGYTYSFTDLSVAGSMINDLGAMIEANMDVIANADLISIGYGNETFAEAAIYELFNALAFGTINTYDWVALVGPEAAAEIEQMLADVYAELVAQGMDITVLSEVTMATAVTAALECYAYNVVTYVLYLPEAINAIHAINPDALVVVVGMSNPFKGTTFAFGESEIVFDEYVDYLVHAANVECVTYAILNENTVYVPVADAESTLTNVTMDFNDPFYLMNLLAQIIEGTWGIEITEAGNEYIVEQIKNALTITVKSCHMLGDVNCDGIVDVEDAMLILQLEALLIDTTGLDVNVADVSGDGLIDVEDAMLILQYEAEIIEKFPAEG